MRYSEILREITLNCAKCMFFMEVFYKSKILRSAPQKMRKSLLKKKPFPNTEYLKFFNEINMFLKCYLENFKTPTLGFEIAVSIFASI